ncbi:MAG: DUF6516 family protein [Candidatus Aerophobetes bacterium]|nr:DUF6516 family protein [Candidatus Aerophobetes bacterium]
MQVKDYFTEIQNLLQKSALIENVNIEYDVKSKNIGIVQGTLEIIDGSTLQFMELINTKGGKITRPRYRFHLMDTNDKVIFRYDNAPHHPEFPTHPHHKHVKGENVPKQSKEVGLKDVLSEIEGTIRK